MVKFFVLLLVIVIGAVIMRVVGAAMRIDLSKVSTPKRIAHNVMNQIYGAAIFACLFYL